VKFTLNTLGAPTWTLEDTAMHARAYGYAGVDLRLLDGEVISLDSVRANRARIKELFAADELPVASLQTSVRLATREPQIRQAALEEGTAWIDLAASGHRQSWPQLKSWIGDVRCRRRSVRAEHHEPDPTSQPQHGAPVHSQYRHSAQHERDAVYRAVGIRGARVRIRGTAQLRAASHHDFCSTGVTLALFALLASVRR
jgi:hypothetical protein